MSKSTIRAFFIPFLLVVIASLSGCVTTDSETEPAADPFLNDATGPQAMGGAYWRPF